MLENTLTYSIFSEVAFFDSLKIYFKIYILEHQKVMQIQVEN